jgi:broad specificity phosphatase PhoE
MPTTILLVRHGETDWNLEGRVQGQTDRPLNETGRRQATELAAALADEPVDAVYSSDLVRAHETARIIAERKGLGVTVIPELREKDFGTWEGLSDHEVLLRFPEARGRPWGDGESNDDVARRVIGALRRIADSHPGGRVLVVAHGGPVRAVRAHCKSRRNGPVANCELLRLEIQDGVLREVH